MILHIFIEIYNCFTQFQIQKNLRSQTQIITMSKQHIKLHTFIKRYNLYDFKHLSRLTTVLYKTRFRTILQIHVYIYLGFLSLEYRNYRYMYIFICFFLSLEYRNYFICVGAGLALLVLVLIVCCCLKNGKSKLNRANKNSVHGVTNHAMVNIYLF